MADARLPSTEQLRQLLRYEPETGKLFWLERGDEWFSRVRLRKAWNNRFAGQEAFITTDDCGYKTATLLSIKQVRAHRVVWAMHFGELGGAEIDHENGIRSDNRLSNLRISTRSQNMMNTRISSRNTSGFKGVSFHKGKGKWCASIKIAGKQRSLGAYASPQAAHAAYQTAAKELFREFANAG